MCHQRACPKIMTEEGSRNNRHGNRYKLELGRKKNENVNNARFFPLDRLCLWSNLSHLGLKCSKRPIQRKRSLLQD